MYSKQSPHIIPVKSGEEVYLCQCGKTAKAPYCDGNHKKTDGVRPFIYTAKKAANLYVCGCGQSANMPWCDGSHKK